MQLHRSNQKKRNINVLPRFNILNVSITLWTNIALGCAAIDLKPSPSSSLFDSILSRTDNLTETAIAAALLVSLSVLHIFGGKKSETKETRLAKEQSEPIISTSATQLANTHRACIAIIDDDIFIRESWELFLQEFDLITFDSPESFLLALDRKSGLINTLDAIVVDYDFGTQSTMSGADLALILRKKTSSPIILSTDREQKDIPDFDSFDLHLDKKILDWHGLQKLLPNVIS